MPVTTTYPGVYVEEVPSGSRPITGVSTSVAAFVGYTPRGPLNEPVQVFGFADYEREFGGLHRDSEVSYAVHQYFLNGGREAWVVRVAANSARASVTLRSGVAGGAPVLQVDALAHGAWANALRVEVDYATSRPDSTFNLTVSEVGGPAGAGDVLRSERFADLTMDSRSPDFVERKVNAASKLVRVRRLVPPGDLAALPAGYSVSGVLPATGYGLDDAHCMVAVAIHGQGPHEVKLFGAGTDTASAPTTIADLRTALEKAVKKVAHPLFANATVVRAKVDDEGATSATGMCLKVVAGNPATHGDPASGEHSYVRITSASAKDAAAILRLGLANGGREFDGVRGVRPAASGTLGLDVPEPAWGGLALSQNITVTVRDAAGAATHTKAVTLEGDPIASWEQARARLEAKLRHQESGGPFGDVRVFREGSRLRVAAGAAHALSTIEVTGASGGTAQSLGLRGAQATVNAQRYAMGPPPATLPYLGTTAAAAGRDGTPPDAAALRGSAAQKEGIHALEKVDLFNLLCIPRTAALADGEAAAVIGEGLAYARRRRAFYLVDPPADRTTRQAVKEWAAGLPKERNAALYFPHVEIPDPEDGFRPRRVPPSATVAGVFARTDTERGVWKAPAGAEAQVLGSVGLAAALTDDEQGTLNPVAINVLRRLPNIGTVVWGSRTLDGSDAVPSEWRYVPVRRTALFLEESLYRGTHWVVFEPNDEPLWAQIRANLSAFMETLFRRGAFAGLTPKDAYFVKCDATTTTRADQDRGVVNIVVGWAPLKPAEFVILRFTQLAGQSQT
jgi:phage tail sheath protein FI